jgi:hypothetical protein
VPQTNPHADAGQHRRDSSTPPTNALSRTPLEIDMNTATLIRTAAVAIAMAAGTGAALAEGDIYSRLFEMKQMDANKDGMVSKEEFLAMVAKLWDMHTLEVKIKGGKMTPEQIKELEKTLGRTLTSQAGG